MLTATGHEARRLPPALRAHEKRLGRSLADYLVENYGAAEVAEIAADFDVSVRTMARWMRLLGIERRLVLVHGDDGNGSTKRSREATAA